MIQDHAYVLLAMGAALALAAWVLLLGCFVSVRKIKEQLAARPRAEGIDPASALTGRPFYPRVIAALLQPSVREGGYRDLPADSPAALAEQMRKRFPELYRATGRRPAALVFALSSVAILLSLIAGPWATAATLVVGGAVIVVSCVPLLAALRHRAVCEHTLEELLSRVLAPPPPCAAPGAGGPRLEVISGMDAQVPLALDRPQMVAGRTDSADIVLPHPSISRHHCRFTRESTGWAVEDLASANGIAVNGKQGKRFSLSDGDSIQIGNVTLRFVEGRAAAAPPPPARPEPGLCPACGAKNPSHYKFCLGCGGELPR